LGISLTAGLPASAAVFQAGAFAVDVTPTFPISLNGGMSDRTATRAADPLHARCLVLDDGKTKLAFAVCDSCAIPREIFDEAKRLVSQKTAIPASNILCSATHTHSAPTAVEVFQSKPDPEYRKYLTRRIAEGIVTAHERLAPAQIGWGVGENPTQVFNRRWKMKPGAIQADPFGRLNDKVQMNPPVGSEKLVEPAGPIDSQVSVLAVRSPKGKPIALLANYSLHYVGDVPAASASADYYGQFAEQISQMLDATDKDLGFVGIMSNGTSGDINNINFRTPHPAVAPGTRNRLVARSVAETAADVYRKMKFHDWVPLQAAATELEFGVRLPDENDLHRAQELLAKAKGRALTTLPEIYANETVNLAQGPAKVRSVLQAMRIGELGIVAIPCEVFVQIGLRLKQDSPLKPTFTIELANGYNGYLPTPEQHQLGGYETWRARSSYLEVGASTKIEAEVVRLLDQVSRKTSSLGAAGK
jgi:hypothetical protein